LSKLLHLYDISSDNAPIKCKTLINKYYRYVDENDNLNKRFNINNVKTCI
jgi:hypothetical protein